MTNTDTVEARTPRAEPAMVKRSRFIRNAKDETKGEKKPPETGHERLGDGMFPPGWLEDTGHRNEGAKLAEMS